MEKLNEGGRVGENLKAGFRKTGVYPINRDKVLKRLPKQVMQEENSGISSLVGETFIEHLEKRREETVATRTGPCTNDVTPRGGGSGQTLRCVT